jgi:hypothetical protein
VDAVIGVGVLLAAPLFQPAFPGRPWTDWPIAVSFLVVAQACVVLRRSAAAAVTLAALAAMGVGADNPVRAGRAWK